MFREKIIPNSDRGYLYIRDSVYSRDKRSLKKKPKKLCDGTGKKERGKYSKKKDIYCGKIIEIRPVYFISFREFLESNNIDKNLFFNKSDFETLLRKYVEYIFYIYDLKEDEFFSIKKKAYTIGEGFMSPIILEWFKKFNLRKNCNNLKEYKRFFYRAQDCGIFDEDFIEVLYLKLIPDTFREDLVKEISELSQKSLKNVKHSKLKEFIKE